jgi:hypothetical protein
MPLCDAECREQRYRKRHQNHSLAEIYLWDDPKQDGTGNHREKRTYLRIYRKGKVTRKQKRVKDVHPSTHIKWKLCLQQEDSDSAITVWYLYC